jgi:hypothetical protein
VFCWLSWVFCCLSWYFCCLFKCWGSLIQRIMSQNFRILSYLLTSNFTSKYRSIFFGRCRLQIYQIASRQC